MEKRRRRWWTIAVTGVSALIVLAAMVSGAFQLVVRSVPGYRMQLEERLGTLLGRPVSIGDLRLTWRGYYPSLDLDRITLLATPTAPDVVSADRLRLAFSLPRLIAGDWMPTRVDLVGAEITASRDAQSRLHVRGFEPTASADTGAILQRLRQIAYLRLVRCVLVWTDEPLQMDGYRFEVVRGDLDQGENHFEFDLELGLPATLGQALSLHADLDGDLAQTATWSGPWAAYLRGLGDGPLIQRWLASDAHLAIDRPRLRLTGELQDGRIPALEAEWESGAINAERAGLHYHLNALEASAKIAIEEDGGWAAELHKLHVQGATGTWPDTNGTVKVARTKDGFDLDAAAGFLRLGDVAPWLHLLRAPPPKLAALHDAGGDVEALTVHWRHGAGDDRYSVGAKLKNLNLSAVGRPAGFANLSGDLSADEDGGRLTLKSIPLWFELPRAFPGPGQFDSLSAALSWQRVGKDWRVHASDLRWRILDSEGQGSLTLLLPHEGSPVMDLNARLSARDPTRFKPFIPFNWGPGLRDWLSTALLAARVPAGEITIKGPLSDFPFDKTNNGTFALDLDVADVRLAFHPEWPTVERLGAHLEFRGNSLAITSDGAAMLGARIGKVAARFDDFHDARLIIDGEVGGDLSRLYRVVEASPLKKTLSALIDHTRAAGPASVKVHLDVPLHDSSKTVASGVIRLKDARLEYQALKEPIRGIGGEIVFAPEGVYSESLTGQFYELPVRATLTAVTPHLSRLLAEFRFAPRADGSGVSNLIPDWIRPQLSGESAWRAELDVGSEANSSLRLSTDLQGVAIKFPAPLAKKAEEVASLNLGFSGDEKIPLRIGIDYKDRFSSDLQFSTARGGGVDLTSAFLRLGDGPAVASEPGVVVEGHVAELDLAAWSAALTSTEKSDHVLALKRADLSIDRPVVGGQSLLATRVLYTPLAGGWQARLQGEGAEGQMTWQSAAGGTLSVQLKHLAMNYHGAEEKGVKTAPQPPLEPAKLPVVDLDCVSLRVGGLDFGHLRLATDRVPGGQKLTQLRLAGGALDLDGSGQWWRRNGASGANLSFHLASERMGDVLRALDYAPTVTAKASRFDGDLLWAPNPAGVEFAQARGHLALELKNGNVKTIEPGAGRVLGLLNFYALPRRLSFNFRDVVGQGLGFDKITGTFDLGDGNAHTSDLLIAGPSVRMETRGRIGLAARDYDQHISVYPDMSSGITLGALLLGGPALGALALIAQQVLDKPLDQVTEMTYHLGGTWDNPEIKRGDGSDDEPRKRRAEPGKP